MRQDERPMTRAKQAGRIVVLTGSGISAESGIATFRDKGGIWAQYDWRDVATIDGYRRNPAAVLEFYNMRRRLHQGVMPNAAHIALARLEAAVDDFLLVTQNVDRLHEMAGSQSLLHMHGEVLKARCGGCSLRMDWLEDLSTTTACPSCDQRGVLRPDVVWFGETPYGLTDIATRIAACDLFISIGTSGSVYPAAGFVARAAAAGAITVELNLEPSEGAQYFQMARHGPATDIVPHFVDQLIAGQII
jgi:NAD-dependent deacetylase